MKEPNEIQNINQFTQNLYLKATTPFRGKGFNYTASLPDENIISAAENIITIWDPKTGKRIHTLKYDGGPIDKIIVSLDLKIFITKSEGVFSVWSAKDYTNICNIQVELQEKKLPQKKVTKKKTLQEELGLQVSEYKNKLTDFRFVKKFLLTRIDLASGEKEKIEVFDVFSGNSVFTINLNKEWDRLNDIAFNKNFIFRVSPSENFLAVIEGKQIKVYETQTWQCQYESKKSIGLKNFRLVDFLSDEQLVITAEDKLALWDIKKDVIQLLEDGAMNYANIVDESYSQWVSNFYDSTQAMRFYGQAHVSKNSQVCIIICSVHGTHNDTSSFISVRVYDLHTGKHKYDYNFWNDTISDRTKIFAGFVELSDTFFVYTNSRIALLDTESGFLLKDFTYSVDDISAVKLLKNEAFAILGQWGNEKQKQQGVLIWDSKTEQTFVISKGDEQGYLKECLVLPDNRFFIVDGADKARIIAIESESSLRMANEKDNQQIQQSLTQAVNIISQQQQQLKALADQLAFITTEQKTHTIDLNELRGQDMETHKSMQILIKDNHQLAAKLDQAMEKLNSIQLQQILQTGEIKAITGFQTLSVTNKPFIPNESAAAIQAATQIQAVTRGFFARKEYKVYKESIRKEVTTRATEVMCKLVEADRIEELGEFTKAVGQAIKDKDWHKALEIIHSVETKAAVLNN